MTPFMALGTGPTTTLQDMISAARFNAHDPSKAFPEATDEEQNEIAMLQVRGIGGLDDLVVRRWHPGRGIFCLVARSYTGIIPNTACASHLRSHSFFRSACSGQRWPALV
jgi:hypothetical protein